MAQTKINGGTQIQSGTITTTQLASGAGITDGQLANSYTKADGSRAFTGDQSMGSHKLTNVTDGTASSDAATWGQVQALANGTDWKQSVRAATTANGALATAYENGDAIDGVTLATGDRILLKNQTTGSENGVYTVNASGAPTRATDADASAEVTAGFAVFVSEGSTNGNTKYLLTTDDPIVLGTTALVFAQIGSGETTVAGAGLTLTGSTVDVVAADTSLTVGANDVAVNIADASLEVSSGLRVKHGTGGQVYIANASGVLTPTTLSGDVSSVGNTGAVTLATTVLKTTGYVNRETPSGTVNGSNVTFTLANTPTSGTEMVFLDGLLQEPAGEDYTLTTNSIAFVSAPESGARIRVTYWK